MEHRGSTKRKHSDADSTVREPSFKRQFLGRLGRENEGEEGVDQISSLPLDIFYSIFTFCSLSDLFSIRSTCRKLNAAAVDFIRHRIRRDGIMQPDYVDVEPSNHHHDGQIRRTCLEKLDRLAGETWYKEYRDDHKSAIVNRLDAAFDCPDCLRYIILDKGFVVRECLNFADVKIPMDVFCSDDEFDLSLWLPFWRDRIPSTLWKADKKCPINSKAAAEALAAGGAFFCNVDRFPSSVWLAAYGVGSVDNLKRLVLAQPQDIDTAYLCRTPLMLAAKHGQIDRMAVLLFNGCQPDLSMRHQIINCRRNNDLSGPIRGKYLEKNWTPLCEAVINGHLGAVNLLLLSGAHPHPEWDCFTPLELAVMMDHEDCVEAMLRAIAIMYPHVIGRLPEVIDRFMRANPSVCKWMADFHHRPTSFELESVQLFKSLLANACVDKPAKAVLREMLNIFYFGIEFSERSLLRVSRQKQPKPFYYE